MTDYTELKRAASAAKNWGGEVGKSRWYAAECFKRPYFSVQDAEFIASLDPGRVLALIDENERLRESHEQICTNYNQVSYASEERGKQIDQLKAELEHTGYDHDLLRNERDQLKAENEALRGVMSAVVTEIPGAHISRLGNAPGHCHSIPGVWDQDNGAKAGKECAWCKVWNYAAAMGKGEQS